MRNKKVSIHVRFTNAEKWEILHEQTLLLDKSEIDGVFDNFMAYETGFQGARYSKLKGIWRRQKSRKLTFFLYDEQPPVSGAEIEIEEDRDVFSSFDQPMDIGSLVLLAVARGVDVEKIVAEEFPHLFPSVGRAS